MSAGGIAAGWGGVSSSGGNPNPTVQGDAYLNATVEFAAGLTGTAYRSSAGQFIYTFPGNFDPASVAVSTASTLPAGLTLSPTLLDGRILITGTPTVAGVSSIVVKTSLYVAPAFSIVERFATFTLRIYAAISPLLEIANRSIPNALPGVAQVFTPVTATVSNPGAFNTDLVYSFVDRGSLPLGASIDSSTGQMSVTFSTAATYSFKIRVRCNSINQQKESVCTVIVTSVTLPDPIAGLLVNWVDLPNATINVAYSKLVGVATAGASSGIGTFTLSERGNLPSGFALSSGGVLTGTITQEGDYSFTVSVAYSTYASVRKNLELRCGAPTGSGGGGGGGGIPPTPPPTPPAIFSTYESDTVTDWYLIHQAQDDGVGTINPVQDNTGTVNYDTGEIYFPPEMLFTNKKWSSSRTGGTGEWNDETNSDVFASGGRVAIEYRPALVEPSTVIETLSVQPLIFSLTPYTSDSIVPGTVRFTIGSTVYEDNEGVIQHTVNGTTGVGTVAGTINYGTGEVNLTNWVAGSSTFTLQSLALFKGNFTETEMYFKIPSAPLRNSSFTLSVTALDGTLLSATADSNQDLIGTGILGTIDAEYGLCSVRFGASVLDSSLTPEEKAEEWYNAGDVVSGYIWQPRKVILATARYNTVAYTSIPLSADVLGIDPVRLPSNGKVPALLKGQLVLVHHTTGQSIGTTLSSDQVFNCGRTRLYRATIAGANGVRLSPEYYTVNRELGTVTMKPSAIVTTGLTTPFWLEHTIADLCVISDNDLSGWLTMTRPLSHTFPITESKVSGVLYIGTLQARVTALFEQSTWTSVWQDTVIGSVPLAQYNDAQYPLIVTNAGAYPDRYLIKFTSSTAFQVIGENLGLIGVGDTSTNCAPLNALTGIPYFTIDYHGWGSGWATGNCLRFNLISASYPVDLARSIQPSAPSGLDVDSVELLLIGNIDQ